MMKRFMCLVPMILVACGGSTNSSDGLGNSLPDDTGSFGNQEAGGHIGLTPPDDTGTFDDTGTTVSDSGVTTTVDDSGTFNQDTGSTVNDSGVVDNDTGSTSVDSGTVDNDTGTLDNDTGVTDNDTGTVDNDTGTSTDTFVPPNDSVSDVVQEVIPTAPTCVYTQGYWKTHPACWPFASITLGDVSYTEDQAISLMNLPSTHDASLIMAQQLVAAILNGGAGVDVMTAASNWMTANKDADGMLPYGVDPTSVAGQVAVNLSTQLDSFNSGKTTLPACK